MSVPGQNWERLYNVALDQYGYVTSGDARELGIDVVQLGIMHSRGQLEHIAYGLYRFPMVPTSERDAYMEAVLWVGRDAALSHDAVLALHGLGLANPRTLRVVTPHRVRRRHPRADITVIRDLLPERDLTSYFRIPSTTVARALLDSRDLVMPSRLREAADVARQQGLLLADGYKQVLGSLDPIA
jgi:predicted transcriptional regulator of viral defense system